MSVLAEIEQQAMRLSQKDRGQLATKLLASLGHPFDGDEDIVALALERDREMDENPESVLSEEEFWNSIDDFRRQ